MKSPAEDPRGEPAERVANASVLIVVPDLKLRAIIAKRGGETVDAPSPWTALNAASSMDERAIAQGRANPAKRDRPMIRQNL